MTKATTVSSLLREKKVDVMRRRTKMPAGRPTTYKSEYVDLALFYCSGGHFTDVLLAGRLGVHWSRIQRWRKKYPEFADAVRKGTESYIIDRLLNDSKNTNTVGIIAIANNVLGWVFRKSVEEHRVREYNIDASGTSTEEREALRKMTPDERRKRLQLVSND